MIGIEYTLGSFELEGKVGENIDCAKLDANSPLTHNTAVAF